MKVNQIVTEEREQLNEIAFAALAPWIISAATFIATAYGISKLTEIIANWILYVQSKRFVPDPDTIPRGIRIKDAQGNTYAWGADREGRMSWFKQEGDRFYRYVGITDNPQTMAGILEDALKNPRGRVDMSQVSQANLMRSLTTTSMRRGDRTGLRGADDLNRMYDDMLKEPDFERRIRSQVLYARIGRVMRIMGGIGAVLQLIIPIIFIFQIRAMRGYIEEKRDNGTYIVDGGESRPYSQQDYQEDLSELRGATLTLVIRALAQTGILVLIALGLKSMERKNKKGGIFRKLTGIYDKLVLGSTVAVTISTIVPRFREPIAEFITNILLAPMNGVDSATDALADYFDINLDQIYAEVLGLADDDIQAPTDAAQQNRDNPATERPGSTEKITIPALPSWADDSSDSSTGSGTGSNSSNIPSTLPNLELSPSDVTNPDDIL